MIEAIIFDCDGTLLQNRDATPGNHEHADQSSRTAAGAALALPPYSRKINTLPWALPVPGALEVLRHWKGRLPMFVASSAPAKELELLLKLGGMDDFFTGIYGSPPGKAEQIRRAARQAGACSYTALMVGDSVSDLDTAFNLDILFYGVGPALKGCCRHWHSDLTLFNSWLAALTG